MSKEEDLVALALATSRTEKQLMDWVSEAVDLRHGAAGDPQGSIKGAPQSSIEEVMDLLLRVRARSDRVDELLTKVTLARGRARRAKEEAAFVADTASMQATKQRGANRVEFSSAAERQAEAWLDTFEERRAVYQRDRLVSYTYDAFEVISGIHWQLDAIRKDLRATLHAYQFESGLER